MPQVKPLKQSVIDKLTYDIERERALWNAQFAGPELPEEQALVQQINNQQQELELRGGEQPKEDSGFLGKAFDVISRPLYASANAFKSLITDEDRGVGGSIADFASGAWKGFTGEEKTTYGDVIEDLGVTGDSITDKILRGGVGFAADVALDPTTYLTLGTGAVAKTGLKEGAEVAGRGLMRGGLEASAKTAAGQAAKEVLETAGKSAGKRVTEKMLDNFVAKGLDPTAKLMTAAEGKKLSAKMIADDAYEAGLKAQDKVLQNTKKTFDIKFAGKPVVRSQTLYKAGEQLSNAFKSTDIGQGLSKTFSTKHNLPGPVHTFKREAEGYSIAQAEDFDKLINGALKGINGEEQRLIADAIELSRDLSGQVAKNGKDLGSVQRQIMELQDSLTQVELGRGILTEDDILDNYVYHHYLTSDRSAASAFKSERKKLQNPNKVKKATTIKTLAEAESAGLKPVREIGDILKARAHKSFSEQARYNWSDAISNEFGVKLGAKQDKLAKKLDLVKASGKYMDKKNVYLPKEIDNAVRTMEKYYNDPDSFNGLLKFFDKNMSNLKFLQTAANPGHHVRNAVGDMYLNMLDGVTNPLRYTQAAKVLDPASNATIKIGNGVISAEKVRSLYKLMGAKAGYTRVEIGARKLGAAEKIREFAETREDWTRMAHFIDALKKEGGNIKNPNSLSAIKELNEAASRAATRVRKWNLDYGDLTETEKKVFRRIAPFYTWTRKNIPLQLEALAMRPGRVATVPKGLTALSQFMGFDEEYPTISGLHTIPKWLRDMSGVRLAGEGEGRNGTYFDPIVIPSVDVIANQVGGPINELLQGDIKGAVGEVAKEGLNQLNVPLRAGVEFGTGRDVFTGAQLDESLPEYLIKSLPVGNLGSKALSGDSRGTDFVNYFTGSSLRTVGEPQRMGEYRRQQDAIEGSLRPLRDQYAEGDYDPVFEFMMQQRSKADAERKQRILDNMASFYAQSYAQNQGY